MDAVRHDQITPEITPFLYELSEKQQLLPLKTLLGFSVGIHPTIWTGLYQERHKKFTIYYYDPKSNYFKPVWYLKLIPFEKLRKYFIGAVKIPYYKFKRLKQSSPKWYKRIIEYPPALPPKMSRFFSCKSQEPEYKESLFSVLEKNKISWHGQADLGCLFIGEKNVNEVSDMKLTKSQADFFYMYFGDGYGHSYGPSSEKVIDYLKQCDKKVKELYTKALKEHGKVNLFAFSDHGMCEVKNFVDLRPVFKSLEFKQPRDFVAFFDATMVRFWYHRKGVREKVVEAFRKVPELTYLDDKQREKYHIRFEDRKWGEDIFLVKTNTRIFPDYFAPIRSGIRGMHGYAPESPCSYGFFITNAFRTKHKEMNVVDIFPSMLKALGLESEIPKNLDGKPVF